MSECRYILGWNGIRCAMITAMEQLKRDGETENSAYQDYAAHFTEVCQSGASCSDRRKLDLQVERAKMEELIV